MTDVTSVPLRALVGLDRRSWRLQVGLGAAALVSAVIAVVLHLPIVRAEPVFTTINVAVVATLVTLGFYMVVRQGERFTGLSFVFAGASWFLVSLDAVYPDWGPYVAWTLAGSTYLAIGWAVLRYRRRRLTTTAERLFVPASAILTIGTSFAAAFLIPPEALGYPANTVWPPVLPVPYGPALAIAVLCLGYLSLGVFYCALMVRMVNAAPFVSRGFLRPMALFGALFGIGSALVQTVTGLMPHVFGIHQAVSAVGAMLLGLCAALAISMLLQQMVGSRFLAQLPLVRTPETVLEYLRSVLGDPTAELLYWASDTNALVDTAGRRRPQEASSAQAHRFSTWIYGSDGGRVALLSGGPAIGLDPAALDALRQVLSIVADNTRLNVVLRMRLAELTATRTAEALAFDKAKEQFHRNLHDGLQQTIASIRLDLDGLHDVVPSTDGHRVVSELEEKLAVALQQVHSLKKGSDPPELRFGLKPAIDRAVAELRLAATCRVSDIDLGILTLPVYYVVRESLTNVHKHAQATHVEIDVTTDGRTVDVAVRDDGSGSASANQDGGIAGMRRRVEELGGVLNVSSFPGEGTTLLASIPRVS